MQEIVTEILLKLSLPPDKVLKAKTKVFPGITANSLIHSIITTSSIEKAGEVLDVSSRSLQRCLRDIFNGPMSKAGGNARFYLLSKIDKIYCNKCGLIKNKEFFNKDSHVSTGYKSTCKSCKQDAFKDYYILNKGAIISNVTKRYAHVRRATPSWANLEIIKNIYENAEGSHVDHIIPLQGELVCGLHVENNLQYLTPEENLSKGNKWEVS